MSDPTGSTIFDEDGYRESRTARLRNLFRHLDVSRLAGKRILEIGCGTGELGQAFVELGCEVVSIDGASSTSTNYVEDFQAAGPL